MGKTYRIKATPGKDNNLVVEIDQDFEQLEILSLKIRQDDVYLRMCADYGIIAGRVFANNGYGIPNAKVSVFIPIKTEDENNPVISSIYPFKSLEDTNEDGFKFNLLPYIPSYKGHVPTGTFPTRKDALVDQTVIELYEKYYKYTVTTNDSGDYMIYGVPVGTQTLVMNVDLSDIGEFSLAPSDLIRMGVATEDQFDGPNFKSSANFNELPQIIVINKTIEVAPFWGQPETCQIGITRSDFDLTAEANIDIQPTAVFLGSIVSSNEATAVDTSNVAKKQTGNLCNLTAGPGEIIAITQTIYRDNFGLPILQRANLPKGGKLIENDGTWMFDLPMNMDYVYTNEYGEKVISDDPSVGIPTKSRCRFKIKWQQSKNTYEDYKRGYFLVPNIREKGWIGTQDPSTGLLGPVQYEKFQRSYAFSLDWSAYTTGSLTITNPDISDSINCEDTFYEFDYNKVYTVSQLIDNSKENTNKERFIGIKRIDDDTCSDSVNRYPVNEGVFHTTLIWRIFNILLIILGIIGIPLIVIYSIVAFLWNWLKYVLYAALMVWVGYNIYSAVQGIIAAATPSVGFGATVWVAGIVYYSILLVLWIALGVLITIAFFQLKDYNFGPIKLPMLTYPDCDACDCDGTNNPNGSPSSSNTSVPQPAPVSNFILPLNLSTTYTDLLSNFSNYFSPVYDQSSGTGIWDFVNDKDALLSLIAGNQTTGTTSSYVPIQINVSSNPSFCGIFSSGGWRLNTNDLPIGERINLFNSKAKYYDDSGGYNRVSVQYDPTNNGVNKHYDNVIVILVRNGIQDQFKSGELFTFISPSKSNDLNTISGLTNNVGTKSITGTTNYPSNITLKYANPSNRTSNINISYILDPTVATDDLYYSYPSDIEYYQVISGMTLSDYRTLTNNAIGSNYNSFASVIEGQMTITKSSNTGLCVYSDTITPIDMVDQNSGVLIIQRGVDPYSPKYPTRIGLGKIFGKTSEDFTGFVIDTDLRLNIPVRNSEIAAPQQNMFSHNNLTNSPIFNNGTQNSGFYLYFDSYVFTPSQNVYSGFTTTLHNYYSRLDYTVANSTTYYIDNSVAASNFSIRVNNGNSNNSNDIWTLNTNQLNESATNNSGYHQTPKESVAGDSYMFKINNTEGYYFSSIYPTGNTFNFVNSSYSKIVMRSDRLPSSDSFMQYKNNQLLLQQNNLISAYLIGSNGVISINGSLSSPAYGGGTIINNNNAIANTVLETFDCNNMVELNCYSGSGLEFVVVPGCSNDDVVENGCYVLVKEPLIGLFEPAGNTDIDNYVEWIYRFRFFYGLCQGVLSNVFTNNWVNGNLFAFPFKVNRYWGPQNQLIGASWPSDVVVLHNESKSFYYRSSPYNGTNFVGDEGDGIDGANVRNLKTPTTIMNLGPRDEFLKEVMLNGNFDGYNVDNLFETSYNDLSETINLFALSRIVDYSFWQGLVGDQITRLFSRSGQRVDGDFAQSAAINSQIGVIPFDSDYYSTSVPPSAPPGQIPSAIVTGGGSNVSMMGIYFSSSTEHMQIRDYISPGRTLRFNPTTNTYTYDYLPIKSQLVPHYKWKIDTAGNTMWGTQSGNNWATNTSDIFAVRYQKMDRLTSPYPVGGSYSFNGLNSLNARGYLFQVDASGNYIKAPDTTPNPALGGAPWYFYFGLLKGSTAINKFYTKYINDNDLNG